jgi:4-hydroxybenzoate polyprenyltransferase
MFVKWMAFLSTLAFAGTGVWAVCIGITTGSTIDAIVPLIVSGSVWAVFVDIYKAKRDKEREKILSNLTTPSFRQQMAQAEKNTNNNEE